MQVILEVSFASLYVYLLLSDLSTKVSTVTFCWN